MSKKEIFHFTVGQLVEYLKSLPQDLPVLTSGYENGFENFHQPSIIKVKHEPENPYYDGEFQVAEDSKKCGKDRKYGEDKEDREDKENETDEADKTFDAVVLQRVVRDE